MMHYEDSDLSYHRRSCNLLDVALALRSTLEAAGRTHEEMVDGAEQVTNALIAQWVAEDMNPASAVQGRGGMSGG